MKKLIKSLDLFQPCGTYPWRSLRFGLPIYHPSGTAQLQYIGRKEDENHKKSCQGQNRILTGQL